MRNRQQPIAVEGYPFIALGAFLTLIFALLGWTFLTLVLLLLTLFTIYFFRNPDRTVPQQDAAVVAPADGKVVYVGQEANAYGIDQSCLKISIFMSVLDVHINRAPISGRVVDSFYQKGAFGKANLDKASQDNEQCGLVLEDGFGRRSLMVQVAGLVARRIVTYPEKGDLLEKGMRIGLIRFGSRVDLYLPAAAQPQVTLGDKVTGGETILAWLEM